MPAVEAEKVGLLVECGPAGLEVVLCRRICELLRREHAVEFQLEVVSMDNKAKLTEDCGRVTSLLLQSGCLRVVILWDERPAWPRKGEPLCWHRDRRRILENLSAAQVSEQRAHLVCIEREFESWLLFDHPMLSAVFSRPTHPVRVRKQRDPHRNKNPKGTMNHLFKKHRRGPYINRDHANDFARHLVDLGRLRRCETFCRFVRFVLGRASDG